MLRDIEIESQVETKSNARCQGRDIVHIVQKNACLQCATPVLMIAIVDFPFLASESYGLADSVPRRKGVLFVTQALLIGYAYHSTCNLAR